MRLGLALSGGGLRATFFHLGIIRYLSETGLLRDIKHITSVSGGSVLAAHLVLNWQLYSDPSRFDEAAQNLIAFAGLDIRGRILRRLPTHFPQAYFQKMRLRRSRATRSLLFETYLDKHLYGETTLLQVHTKDHEAPNLDILATNLTRGTLAYFTDDCFAPDEKKTDTIRTEISLAKAVAISAAFPGFFPPIELDNEALGVDNEIFPTTEYLTDGGVYDNLGLRRFRTLLSQPEPPVDHVLVCDASGHFDWVDSREESLGLLKTALRSTEIFMKRLAELESEVFSVDGETRFTHIQISDAFEPAQDQTRAYLSSTEQKLLKNIRTDLDYFSPIETACLDSHGYSVAEETCKALCSGKEKLSPAMSRTLPMTAQARVKALKKARFRSLRFFSMSDRISYFHVLFGALVLIWPGMHFTSGLLRENFLDSLHAYGRDSFGLFEIKSPAEAGELLEEVEDAQQRWVSDTSIQTDIALAAYSVFKSAPALRERSFKLFESSLNNLGSQMKQLSQSQKILYYQLKGHYFLEEGEKLLRKADPAAARRKYLAALESYQDYRRLSFRNLHVLEFDLCNAARKVGQLDYALERCEAADRYARENRLSFWQAKVIAGRIHEKKGNIQTAATNFHEAWEIASRASEAEEHRFKKYLRRDVKQYPLLCSEPPFQRDLSDLCLAIANPL